VGCSEIEIDVLTGESEIIQSDIVYDCGKSLNPAIDIGQAEGAFVIGLGMMLREQVLIDESGELISNGTWEYKPPGVRDVPHQLNVEFIENDSFTKGILSSKAVGEPPLLLASTVILALRQAIGSARQDAGVQESFDITIPCTVDQIQTLCAFDSNQFYGSQEQKLAIEEEKQKAANEKPQPETAQVPPVQVPAQPPAQAPAVQIEVAPNQPQSPTNQAPPNQGNQ